MLKVRLIPVLLLKNGHLVRSERFATHQIIGNPVHEVQRFNQWNVDELIYLDISTEGGYDLRRDDTKVKNLSSPHDILSEVSKTCFMPLTWGGRIRSLEDMQGFFQRGADKITLNTAAFLTPSLITDGARKYGSQAIVVCIDVARRAGGYEVAIQGGKQFTGMTAADWAREAERRGAGEILLQSIDRDGMAEGYDLDLIAQVASRCKIPVIALGGCGHYQHYAEAVRAGASAVAAANLWHFKELADRDGKRALAKAGIPVRL